MNTILSTETTPPAVKSAPPSHVWLKRVLIGLVILVVALPLAGAAYQLIGGKLDEQTYPAPGQRVDVGGRKLYIYCTGETNGNPTVLLETLSGGAAVYWGWVQPQVAQVTRVCSYDRAGRGWSDPIAAPHDLNQTVDDLSMLLKNAGITGPYVLVGHSIGGLYVRAFAARHPVEVAGMVLLDSSHPDEYIRHPEMLEANRTEMSLMYALPLVARLGLARLYFAAGGEFDFGGMPPRERAEMKMMWSSPDFQTSRAQEMDASPTIFAQAHNLGTLGSLPLIVVTAAKGASPAWSELQQDLASLSTNSEHRILDDATHVSLVFNPKHAELAARAILDVVAAARTGSPLAAK